MEFKKYQKTKADLEHYDVRISTLQELLKEANQKRQMICDECSHDFVFVYNEEAKKINHPEKGIIKHAKCLVCGEHFRLNEHYINFETEDYLQSKNIIDATLFMSDYTQRLMRGQDNVAYTRAKQEFDKMLNADNGSLREIDYVNQIRLKTYELDQYYVNLEAERKQNYEEELTKKKK